MIRYVNFLDKNVISLVNDVLKEKRISDKKKLEMFQKLKKMDNKNNAVSSLLSIIEGRNSGLENSTQKLDSIKIEIDLISKFFKNAKTDSSFFKENILETALVLSTDSIEIDQKKYIDFLNFFYEKWAVLNERNNIPKEKKKIFIEDILNYVNTLKISSQHPVVITAALAVYGKNAGMLVLKPNEPNAYNAYNDIAIITRLSMHQAKLPHIHFKFHTLDKGLNALFEVFQDKQESRVSDNLYGGDSIAIKYKLPENILPKAIFDLLAGNDA